MAVSSFLADQRKKILKQIENYNDGKDKNINLVFNFLCKTTDSQSKTGDNLGKEKSTELSTKKILRVSTKFVSKKKGQNIKTLSDLAETPLGSETAELRRKLGTIRIKKENEEAKISKSTASSASTTAPDAHGKIWQCSFRQKRKKG